MAKIKWQVSKEGYGVQFEVIKNTRSDAIAYAEALYMQETAFEDELIGSINEDGSLFERSKVPVFTAKKVK